MSGTERVRDPHAPPDSARLIRNSLSVGTWTAVSRATGLGRVTVTAAVLGPTYLGNLYQSTNLLPNMVFGLLTGSLFVSLLVPPLVRHADASDPRAVERVAGGFLGVVIVVFAAVAVLAIAAAPLVMKLLTAGVTDPAVAAAQRRAGAFLLAILMPQVLLYGIAGTGEAIMNAHGRFSLAAAAPALENVGVIATLAAVGLVFGTGTPLAEVTPAQLQLLGIGTTGAVGLHAAAQWWGARRTGIRLRVRAGWRDPEVRGVLGRAVPTLGYSALSALRGFGTLVVANRVPGGVVAFELARTFYFLPPSLGARPVSIAQLPQLSRLFHLGRLRAFHDELVRGVALGLFLTIPAAVAYVVLAGPLARAVSFGEMAGPAGVLLVTVSLGALGLGVVGESAFQMGTNASYARGDARAPFHAMVVRTVLATAGMTIAFYAVRGPAVLLVLGMAITVSDLVSARYLHRRNIAMLPRGEERLTPALLRAVSASAVMAAAALAVAVMTRSLLAGPWQDQLVMLLAAVTGLLTFFAVQRLWRSPELSALVGGLGLLRTKMGGGA